jgi:uncharacterized protein
MIRRESDKKVIMGAHKVYSTILSKARGLMFTRRHNLAVIFPFASENRVCLHMLFVFYPIDVIFLDCRGKIVDLKEHFKPFSLNYTSKKPAKTVIELPEGTIRGIGLKSGDIIEIV